MTPTMIKPEEGSTTDTVLTGVKASTIENARSGCCDGPDLRCVMMGPLKHIRLRTMSSDDLYQCVFQSKILTSDEIADICSKNISSLDSNCKITEVRRRDWKIVSSQIFKIEHERKVSYSSSHKSLSKIYIREQDIVLNSFSMRCQLYIIKDFTSAYFSRNKTTDITLKVARIINPIRAEELTVIIHKTEFQYHALDKCTFPTTINGRGVTLKANNMYMIDLDFGDTIFAGWEETNCVKGHDFKHGIFYCSQFYIEGKGTTPCVILELEYDLIDS